MKISKTLFKELIRCPSYYGFNKLYFERKKVNLSNKSFSELKYYLDYMIDEDTKEDKIKKPLKLYEQEQFEETEKVLIKYANKILKTEFKAESLDKQKQLFYRDSDGNSFYTKTDAYQETKDEIIVLEVKAKSTTDFLDIKTFAFEKNESILYLPNKEDFLSEKQAEKQEKFIIKSGFDPIHKVGRYLLDGLYTYWLVSKNNPRGKKITFYLALLNHEYYLDKSKATKDNPYPYLKGSGEIVVLLDLSRAYKKYFYLIENYVEHVQRLIRENKFIEPVIASRCKRNNDNACEFCSVCFGELESLPGSAIFFEGEKKYEDIIRGKKTMDKYSDEELIKDIHRIQKRCFIKNEQHVDREMIKAWIEDLKYPVYYLDFESFNAPLPRFDGEKPYTQSVFQFSLHTEHTKTSLKDIDDNHFSFLAPDFEDYRKECAEALIREIDLKKGGTIIAYNASFEKTRIEELAKLFPQYEKKLLKIRNHIIDLKDALVKSISGIKKAYFYDNKLEGSYSIKKVLPVFAPELSYKDLEIQEGMMAQEAYYSFQKLDEEDLEEVRKNLEEYCKLDTWSMVLIVHALSKP